MTIRIFSRDDLQLDSRPAVVLLPAFPFDRRMWQAVVTRLEGLPVVTVDPPGFGQADDPIEQPSLDVYADALMHALRAEDIRRSLIVGNSMGGYVAMTLMDRYPADIGGIVLIGTNAGTDDTQMRAKRTEVAIAALMGRAQIDLAATVGNLVSRSTRTISPEVVETMQGWVKSARGEGIAWASRAMASRPDRINVLRNFTGPAFVMRGEEDNVTSPEQTQIMAQALRVPVIEVPRAGHLVPLEAPSVVARAILSLYPNVCV